MTYGRYNFRQIKRTAVALLMITAIAVLLFTAFCPSAGAVGLVDDSVDAAHEYSRYPLENYQLDFYVDNGWDWWKEPSLSSASAMTYSPFPREEFPPI